MARFTYNIYCDESCHLENDGHGVMVLGAVWCPSYKTREITERLREIKACHGMSPLAEMKWNKVSPAGEQLYMDTLDYFFDDDDLHFRGLVVPDKLKLRDAIYAPDHDDRYYRLYFDMLKVILDPRARHRIYLDIKDTHGAAKVARLQQILTRTPGYDFPPQVIENVQIVRSHEVETLQLTDLLIGALSYAARGLTGSKTKQTLVARLKKRSGYDLARSTLLRENKVNLFVWQSQERHPWEITN